MNPNPFASLNHFTVPVAIIVALLSVFARHCAGTVCCYAAAAGIYRFMGLTSTESARAAVLASYRRHAHAHPLRRTRLADERHQRQPMERRLPLARSPASRTEGDPFDLRPLVRGRHLPHWQRKARYHS